jgi:5-hydroxyisourate hydrolase
MTVSTHVLDAMAGRPAARVPVSLSYLDPSGAWSGGPSDKWVQAGSGETDADGRHRFAAGTDAGVYRLTFGTGRYFAAAGVAAFYPEVTITFSVSDSAAHYHVPLLLSPFAYSTYRGS